MDFRLDRCLAGNMWARFMRFEKYALLYRVTWRFETYKGSYLKKSVLWVEISSKIFLKILAGEHFTNIVPVEKEVL
jgi:hypothetical protein